MAGKGKLSEELKGKVFGRLTVIEKTENRNGRTAWLCRCACGNYKTVLSKYLKNGSVQSCGCLKKEIQESKAKDVSGNRFGKLIALYPTKKRDINGSVIWMCQCDCGNTAEVSIAGLESGNNISCGCAKANGINALKECRQSDDKAIIRSLNNSEKSKGNTLHSGISLTKDGRYCVSIGFKRKKYRIGTYSEYSVALRKRLEAEELLFKGYLRAKELWSRKEPLIYEAVKEKGIIRVFSNLRSENGKFMICRIRSE